MNLAAELRGTSVTVNAYRPGGVDTAGDGRVPRHHHRQRPRNPDLLDGDDVHRPDRGIARQQLAGGLAERLGQWAAGIR